MERYMRNLYRETVAAEAKANEKPWSAQCGTCDTIITNDQSRTIDNGKIVHSACVDKAG